MKRVRLGVIGCGAIAQVQHLPFLTELAEEFEVAVVCDVSPSAAKYAAGLFHVPKYVTDYQDVLVSDVDAVLLCHTDPKTDVAVASFRAGKHVFIEKPMCFSLQEADSIVAAAHDSGKVGQGRVRQAVRAGLRGSPTGGSRHPRNPLRASKPPAPEQRVAHPPVSHQEFR